MYRRTNAAVSAAAANIARHRRIDIGIRRFGIFRQERRRAHDLARLAVAALRYVLRDPGLLHRLADFAGTDRFDCVDLLSYDGGNRRYARARRHAIDMHRAGAALSDAAAELSTGKVQAVAQGPKQWCFGRDVRLQLFSVYVERNHLVILPWGLGLEKEVFR